MLYSSHNIVKLVTVETPVRDLQLVSVTHAHHTA